MRQMLISCALSALVLPAAADDNTFRCIDSQGAVMLTDRPCETVPNVGRPAMAKEHVALPPSEQGRGSWTRKPAASEAPKVDVETLRVARQTLALRDKVASAR